MICGLRSFICIAVCQHFIRYCRIFRAADRHKGRKSANATQHNSTMTALPEGYTFFTSGEGDITLSLEMTDEWTLEELHQALVNNEFKTLYLSRLLRPSRPDVTNAVLDGIRQNTSIECLELNSDNDGFTDEMQLDILIAVSSLPKLRELSWSYTQWSNQVCRALSEFVSSSNLKKYSNYLCQDFRTPPSEEEFKARYETSALMLANSVRANETLEDLRVSFELTPSGLAKLFDAIIEAGNVRVLRFSENGGHPYLEHLTEAISLQQLNAAEACTNSRLEKIDFGTDEDIPNGEAIKALCELTKLHPRLVYVSLETTRVTDPNVCLWLDWNRYGRQLLSPGTTTEVILESLEEVNTARPNDGDDSDDEDEDDRPDMSTTITYKILHDVCLPNSFFG